MSSSAFSSSVDSSLNRQTESDAEECLNLSQVWNEAHSKVCLGWIKDNGYKNICLQFSDDYLAFSVFISDSLKTALDRESNIYILADTSYGSCCVDEIAAAHVEADCLIHFGNACPTKVSRLPILYMFPELDFSMSNFVSKLHAVSTVCEGKQTCVYFDIGYGHLLNNSSESFDEFLTVKLRRILPNSKIYIEVYPQANDGGCDYELLDDRICIFIGRNNIRFANLSLTTKAAHWFIYDPIKDSLIEQNPLTANFIRRRYFYIEKCKDAHTLGLIVATLSSTGYLQVIARIQEMAKLHGIKTQIISVGRINPSKLANFLDIDCFVLIGCSFNNMFCCRDYYKPIVTVFEAEIALNPSWYMRYPDVYVTDFKELLPEGKRFLEFKATEIKQQDISLVSGRVRHAVISNEENFSEDDSQITKDLSVRSTMEITTANTVLSYEDRTWKGLDPAIGCTEPARVQKGLSGIPISYTHSAI